MPNANWFPRSRIAKGDSGCANLHAGVASDDRDQFAATDRGGCFECLEANRLATTNGATHGLTYDLAELGGAAAAKARNASGNNLEICG